MTARCTLDGSRPTVIHSFDHWLRQQYGKNEQPGQSGVESLQMAWNAAIYAAMETGGDLSQLLVHDCHESQHSV